MLLTDVLNPKLNHNPNTNLTRKVYMLVNRRGVKKSWVEKHQMSFTL